MTPHELQAPGPHRGIGGGAEEEEEGELLGHRRGVLGVDPLGDGEGGLIKFRKENRNKSLPPELPVVTIYCGTTQAEKKFQAGACGHKRNCDHPFLANHLCCLCCLVRCVNETKYKDELINEEITI